MWLIWKVCGGLRLNRGRLRARGRSKGGKGRRNQDSVSRMSSKPWCGGGVEVDQQGRSLNCNWPSWGGAALENSRGGDSLGMRRVGVREFN